MQIKTRIKSLLPSVLKVALLPLSGRPAGENRIVFLGQMGRDVWECSGNPYYLCRYLDEQTPEAYELNWVVRDPSRYADYLGERVRLLKHGSLSSLRILLTARVVVTNGSYVPWFPFRKDQYVINTWHGGGAYKRNENARPGADAATARRARHVSEHTRLFISTCRMASEKIMRGTYGYEGRILECGMPRNDRLVRYGMAASSLRAGDGDQLDEDAIAPIREAADKVRRYFGIPEGERILLYAPTYRPAPAGDLVPDLKRIRDLLEQEGRRWHVLIRSHHYQRLSGEVISSAGYDASGYPDMQELLAATDLLITDYSSAIWDYSFLYRPCLLYVPDLDSYRQDPGFYVDIDEWPYPWARTQEELEELLTEALDGGAFREVGYAGRETVSPYGQLLCERIDAHHRLMGSCESGFATERIVRRIRHVCAQAGTPGGGS